MSSTLDRFAVRRAELERIRKQRGLTEEAFCQQCRRHPGWPSNTFSRRTLGNWKNRKTHPSLVQIEVMARVLRVKPDEIADLDANVVDEFQRADTVRYLKGILGKPAIVGSLIAAAESLYPWYTRRLSLSMHVRDAVNRDLHNPGYSPPGFASIRIRSPVREATWTLAFQFFGVRVDYGQITRTDDELALEEFFTAHRDSAVVRGQELRVATWFGRDPCRFVVRSSEDFEFELLERGSPVHVSFSAATHHTDSAPGPAEGSPERIAGS